MRCVNKNMLQIFYNLKIIFTGFLFFSIIVAYPQVDLKKILKPVEINSKPPAPPPPLPPEDRNEHSDKKQLAAKYFNNGEFEKAVVLYKELFETDGNHLYYVNYLTCLENLERFEEAEQMIKKQIKKRSNDQKFKVDLGYIYDKQGKKKKATKTFDDIIKDLPSQRYQILSVSNAFLTRSYFDYALETLEKGNKKIKDYSFQMEIANIQYLSRKYNDMVLTFLEYIEVRPEEYINVQNRLQYYISKGKDNSIEQVLRNQLLIKIQKNPRQIIFSRMLLWLSIQQKDFEIALQQAKAIDKRSHDEGETLLDLGKICFANKAYDVAISSFKEITKKGRDNYLYVDALIGLLSSRYQKITDTTDYNLKDLTDLEADYKNTIEEFGKNASTLPIMRDLAHLQTFYLDKPEPAITLLNEAIKIPRATKADIALCKIQLADIYLLTEEVWEASLLYSQVEKSLKHDAIGDIAKFKNIKLSFYLGEFEWARNQLYALKGSTSSLIANDAILLSVMISDNIEADSSTTALTLYAKADLLLFKKKPLEALSVMDSILNLTSYHAIFDDVLLLKAKTNIDLKQYDIASKDLETIINDYPWDITADNALFLLADMNQFQFKNNEKAKELYLRLLNDYSGSLFVTEARKRYRKLRGDEEIE